MGRNVTLKLINFGLMFKESIRLLVSDMNIPSMPVPIIINQQFQSWVPDDFYNQIGKATFHKDGTDLYVDLDINQGVMLAQPDHHSIIFRSLWGDMYAFDSFSLLLDDVSYEEPRHDLLTLRITESTIKSISPVPCWADPGAFLFRESYKSSKVIVFTGPIIDKYVVF